MTRIKIFKKERDVGMLLLAIDIGIAVWFTEVGPGIVVWVHHSAFCDGAPRCSLFQCFVNQ